MCPVCSTLRALLFATCLLECHAQWFHPPFVILFSRHYIRSHTRVSRGTQKLVGARFVWPKVKSDVKMWASSCLECQLSKTQRHNLSSLSSFSNPDALFDNIHIDIVGPLPEYTYLLTCVDRFTRLPEAFPMRDMSADTVAQTLVSGCVSCFGVPSIITTDRGGQFESTLLSRFMTLLGTTHFRTTSYHPQANGLVERFHRQLKGALKAQPSTCSWTESLPLVLLGIRTAVKEDLKFSTAN